MRRYTQRGVVMGPQAKRKVKATGVRVLEMMPNTVDPGIPQIQACRGAFGAPFIYRTLVAALEPCPQCSRCPHCGLRCAWPWQTMWEGWQRKDLDSMKVQHRWEAAATLVRCRSLAPQPLCW